MIVSKLAGQNMAMHLVHAGGCSGDDVATKDVDEDLEEGELLDDGEPDEKEEEKRSEIVDPPAPAAIPSLLDMKISPPRNGKTTFKAHNTLSMSLL